MDNMNFEVDFTGVKDKQDVIRKLVLVFKLPEEFHMPAPGSEEYTWNWDAFEDYFMSLDSDSEIIRTADPKPESVYLLVKNIDEVKKVSDKDHETLLAILQDATKDDHRGDKIQFSFGLVK